jgi:radical SAM-linked protein
MADVPGDKLRLRFSKTGTLRLLSHHDLMRCAERMLRRAEVPFKLTGGFHPTPRLVFALSLPLGVAGRNEVVEIELTHPLPAAEVLDRLNRTAPDGLTFLSAKTVPMKASAVPRRAVYCLPIPYDRSAEVRDAAEALLAEPKVWVDKYHPRPRRVNVRPYIRGIGLAACGLAAEAAKPQAALTLDLWVTGQGTARAEDVFKRLGLEDVLNDGAVQERTDLEIRDETPPGQPDDPPDGPPETAPLDHAPALSAGEEDDPATRATWGLSPNGPVVE